MGFMTGDIHTYNNGQTYRTVSTHAFKTHFSAMVRDMDADKYDGVVVTSYGRTVGVFLPHARLARERKNDD